jgi:hypothetical protein
MTTSIPDQIQVKLSDLRGTPDDTAFEPINISLVGTQMTYADLLCSLRERLVAALKNNDRETLQRLMNTFGILSEASCTPEPHPLCGVLADLAYSAQHGFMGVMAKAMDVPSEERIRSAFDKSS